MREKWNLVYSCYSLVDLIKSCASKELFLLHKIRKNRIWLYYMPRYYSSCKSLVNPFSKCVQWQLLYDLILFVVILKSKIMSQKIHFVRFYKITYFNVFLSCTVIKSVISATSGFLCQFFLAEIYFSCVLSVCCKT